jgi:hypothetical protein
MSCCARSRCRLGAWRFSFVDIAPDCPYPAGDVRAALWARFRPADRDLAERQLRAITRKRQSTLRPDPS